METKTFWLLLLILIIAGFFRLYQIKTIPPGLYPDEAIGGNQGLEALRTGNWELFYPENNGRAGLFVNLQGIAAGTFGATSTWPLRLPSAIFGILTVWGIYFLGKELFSKRIGLLSAFFAATSFWHILFSRIGFDGVLAPFFLVWGTYFLLNSLRNERYKLKAATGGIIYGLGLHSYIAYRITPLLIIFILFVCWRKAKKENRGRKFFAAVGWFLLAAFIAALPMGIYFLKHPADFSSRTSELSIFNSSTPLKDLGMNIVKTLGMLNFRGDSNWRQNYASRPELFWPVSILFLIGMIIAIKNIIQSSRSKVRNSLAFEFWLLFFWFALGAAPAVFSDEGIPHALRSILMIPPVFIFSGVGGIAVYDFLEKYIKSFWLPAATIIFLSLLVFEAYNTYFNLWAKNPNTYGAFSSDYVELGKKLNSLPPALPKYVIIDASGVLVNGIPMPAQTVMFITDTFTPEKQKEKNVYYVLPDEEKNIPKGSLKFYLN